MISRCQCPCCHEGKIGYRLCNDRETIVLLCELCALVWTHPNKVNTRQACDPLDHQFARQHPQVQLRGSRWATEQEIQDWGWGIYLLKPTDLQKTSAEENHDSSNIQ